MRISDWSSDLCSSDLSEVRREQPEQRTAQPFPEARMLGVVQQQLFGVLPSIGDVRGQLLGEWIVVDHDIQLEIQQQAAREIGRASCREMGCQYVWLSVVAVQYKTNNKARKLM